MASPDFSDYVDLTINDVQPSDIYEGAVNYAVTALPEFSPRTGTVEDALLQAMAYISGTVTGAVNRLPNGLMEGILQLFGFQRNQATFATGNIKITALDANGLTIPAGFRLAYLEQTETETIQHVFVTTQQAIISPGNTVSADIPVVAASSGLKPVIEDQDSLLVLTASSRVFSAVFSGSIVQGAASETDEEYFSRGTTFLASLNASLATADQITNHVLVNHVQAGRVKTYDLTKLNEIGGVQLFESSGSIGASLIADPTAISPAAATGQAIRLYGASDGKFNGIYELTNVNSSTVFFSNTVGASSGETLTDSFDVEFLQSIDTEEAEVAGSILTVIRDSDGQEVSDTDIAPIVTDVDSRIVAGLDYDVINAIVPSIGITINISVRQDFDELIVRQTVDQVISEYVSPETWDWSSRLRKNAIISRASGVAGVDYVDSVAFSLDVEEEDIIISQATDGTDDLIFLFKGMLPSGSVTVGTI